jgi:hypothetical protein
MMDTEPGRRLVEQFHEGSEAPTFSEGVTPENWVEAGEMYYSFASLAASLIYAALHDGSALGLWIAGSGIPSWSFAFGRLYQKFSLAPLHGNVRTVFPYLLGYDKTKPTYRMNGELAAKLEPLIMAGKVS